MSEQMPYRAQVIRGEKPRGTVHHGCDCNLEFSGVGEFETYIDAVRAATGNGRRAFTHCPHSGEIGPENLLTHIGTVHAPGRYRSTVPGLFPPKCATTPGSVLRLHLLAPTASEVTCRRCTVAVAKEEAKFTPKASASATVEPIPENWLYMAKHAKTETARAWWRKKCGIVEEDA